MTTPINREPGTRPYVNETVNQDRYSDRGPSYTEDMSRIPEKAVLDIAFALGEIVPQSENKKPYKMDSYPEMEYNWGQPDTELPPSPIYTPDPLPALPGPGPRPPKPPPPVPLIPPSIPVKLLPFKFTITRSDFDGSRVMTPDTAINTGVSFTVISSDFKNQYSGAYGQVGTLRVTFDSGTNQWILSMANGKGFPATSRYWVSYTFYGNLLQTVANPRRGSRNTQYPGVYGSQVWYQPGNTIKPGSYTDTIPCTYPFWFTVIHPRTGEIFTPDAPVYGTLVISIQNIPGHDMGAAANWDSAKKLWWASTALDSGFLAGEQFWVRFLTDVGWNDTFTTQYPGQLAAVDNTELYKNGDRIAVDGEPTYTLIPCYFKMVSYIPPGTCMYEREGQQIVRINTNIPYNAPYDYFNHKVNYFKQAIAPLAFGPYCGTGAFLEHSLETSGTISSSMSRQTVDPTDCSVYFEEPIGDPSSVADPADTLAVSCISNYGSSPPIYNYYNLTAADIWCRQRDISLSGFPVLRVYFGVNQTTVIGTLLDN